MTSHQRKNATSNTAVGADFERLTMQHLLPEFPNIIQNFSLPIGYLKQKNHPFDLGCHIDKVIVECKSHTWTEGGNVPSAKMTTWDQAMLYFFLAPRGYRKLFINKRDIRVSTGESLATYYIRTHYNVIPDEVEFWEIDELDNIFERVPYNPWSNLSDHSAES